MNISKSIFAMAIAATFLVTSCKDTKSNTETTEEHGHEHDANGNHEHEETVNQEEFNVNGTSEKPEQSVIADEQSNEATIVVKANKALEYKFKLDQYEKLSYKFRSADQCATDVQFVSGPLVGSKVFICFERILDNRRMKRAHNGGLSIYNINAF